MRVLGLGIGRATLRAVIVERGALRWAAEARYGDGASLSDAIAQLASEAQVPVRRARIALERDVVQFRTVVPVPPLGRAALRRYVALEAPRLFRQNGDRLVTDAVRVVADGGSSVLWAAAASEGLIQAALDGCAAAGLMAESVGPAASFLPQALASPPPTGEVCFPEGDGAEVLTIGPAGPWRSRRVPDVRSDDLTWAAPLAQLGPGAPRFAAAFAATRARPQLTLVPAGVKAARTHEARRRRLRLTLVGTALWLSAGVVFAARSVVSDAAAARELAAGTPAVDSALAVRRQLETALGALGVIASARASRSRQLELLAALSVALGDSTFLVALHVERDGTMRLAGYAPSAAGVLARVEGVPRLRSASLEGPVTRETVPGRGPLDRFAIVAQRQAAR